MRRLLCVPALLAAVGCGGTGIGGTVGGKDFDLGAAIWLMSTLAGVQVPTIVATSESDACRLMRDRKDPKSESVLLVMLFEKTGSSIATPTAAGTYRFTSAETPPDGPNASGAASVVDATCTDTLDESKSVANAGEVVVDGAIRSGEPLAGTMNVQFPSAGRLEGGFEAAWCDAPWPDDTTCP